MTYHWSIKTAGVII